MLIFNAAFMTDGTLQKLGKVNVMLTGYRIEPAGNGYILADSTGVVQLADRKGVCFD